MESLQSSYEKTAIMNDGVFYESIVLSQSYP